MARALCDGTILMHGGGNFGDRYIYHEFRHRILADFPANKAVVFPQTAMFFDNEKLTRSAGLFSNHRDVALFSRDVVTHHVLQRYFGAQAKVVMAPDMAFMLGPQPRILKAQFDIVWLARTDKEKAHGDGAEAVTGLSGRPLESFAIPAIGDDIASTFQARSS